MVGLAQRGEDSPAPVLLREGAGSGERKSPALSRWRAPGELLRKGLVKMKRPTPDLSRGLR